MKDKIDIKQIVFRLSEADHKKIKMSASCQGISMKDFILVALEEKMLKDKDLGW